MKLSSIILWSVFYLISTGNSSRMRSFLLQLIQVRFPNRRSIFICIKQGQGHGKGTGHCSPPTAGPRAPPGRPLITARARRAHTSEGAGSRRGVVGPRARGEAAGRAAGGRCEAGGLGCGAVAGGDSAPQWRRRRRREKQPRRVPGGARSLRISRPRRRHLATASPTGSAAAPPPASRSGG